MKSLLAALVALLFMTGSGMAQPNACIPDFSDVALHVSGHGTRSEGISLTLMVSYVISVHGTNTPGVLSGELAASPSEEVPCDGTTRIDAPYLVCVFIDGPRPTLLGFVEVAPGRSNGPYADTIIMDSSQIPREYRGAEVGLYAKVDSCFAVADFGGADTGFYAGSFQFGEEEHVSTYDWCAVREFDEINNKSDVVTVFLP